MITLSITMAVFPSNMYTKKKPTRKSDNEEKDSFRNYRPVSNMAVIYQNLWKQSTLSNTVRLPTSVVTIFTKKSQQTILSLLYSCNIFDTINHTILVLRDVHIFNGALNWFTSYLQNNLTFA